MIRKIIILGLSNWIFSTLAINTLDENQADIKLQYNAPIQAIAMSPTEPVLISVIENDKDQLHYRNLKTHQENTNTFNDIKPKQQIKISFSSNGKRFLLLNDQKVHFLFERKNLPAPINTPSPSSDASVISKVYSYFKEPDQPKQPEPVNIPFPNFNIPFPSFGALFLPNSQDIILGNSQAKFIFKTNNNQPEKLFDCYSCQFDLAISPDGKYLLTGSDEPSTYLWNLNSGEKELIFENNASTTAVAISPDGTQFLMALGNQTVKLWTWGNENHSVAKLLKTIPYEGSDSIQAVTFLPNGNGFLIASDNKAYLWRNGELDTVFQFQQPINHMDISPKTEQVAFAVGKNIFLFNLFVFPDHPIINMESLTQTEVSTMARLGVKIRYENEQALRPLMVSDSPTEVIKAIELNMSDLFLDELPSWLGKFTQLRHLNLSKNKLKLTDLNILRVLTQLETLDLSDNPIFTDEVAGGGNFFAPFQQLLKLNLHNTNLSNEQWGSLGISQLIELDLSNNSLTKLLMNNFKRLKKLNISHNQIVEMRLENMPAVDILDVSFNKLPRLDLSTIPTNIRKLYANNNNIRSVKFNRDKDLKFLLELHLENNLLTELPESMGTIFVLQNLQILDILNNPNIRIPEALRRKVESFYH